MSTVNKYDTRSIEEDQVHEFGRIKPKRLYKMAFGDIKYLNRQRRRLLKNSIVIAIIIFVPIIWFFSAGISEDGSLVIPMIFVMIFVSVFVGGYYSSRKGRLSSDFKRVSTIGMISRAMKNSSYRASVMIDNRDKTSSQFVYRETRSPYSGSRKNYHFMQWLVYDTNLKNMDPSVNGVKLKIDSHLKTKTKSGNVVRETFTLNIKFFFHIDFIMKQEKYDQLLKQLRYEVEVPPYESYIFVSFPNDSTIKFKLKIVTPIKEFRPYYLPAIVQDFWNDLKITYNSIFDQPLRPLKTPKQTHEIKAKDDPKQTMEPEPTVEEITEPVPITEEVAAVEPQTTSMSEEEKYIGTESNVEEDLEKALYNISISLGDYKTTEEKGGKIISYEPFYNYFVLVEFKIGDYYEMNFSCREPIRKKISFTLDIKTGEVTFLGDSERPSRDLLDIYRINRHVNEAKKTGSMDFVHVLTGDDYLPKITITSKNPRPKFLEDGLNFAKSILQELKYL